MGEKNKLGLISLIPHGNEIAKFQNIQNSFLNLCIDKLMYPIEAYFCPLFVYDTSISIQEKKELLENTKKRFEKNQNPIEIQNLEIQDYWLYAKLKTGLPKNNNTKALEIAAIPALPDFFSLPLVFTKNKISFKKTFEVFNEKQNEIYLRKLNVFQLALLEFSWKDEWDYAFCWETIASKWVKIKKDKQ